MNEEVEYAQVEANRRHDVVALAAIHDAACVEQDKPRHQHNDSSGYREAYGWHLEKEVETTAGWRKVYALEEIRSESKKGKKTHHCEREKRLESMD